MAKVVLLCQNWNPECERTGVRSPCKITIDEDKRMEKSGYVSAKKDPSIVEVACVFNKTLKDGSESKWKVAGKEEA